MKEARVNKALPIEGFAGSEANTEKSSGPKRKVEAIAALQQIQLRAYFIAEHRKSSGISGDEAGDWAQAERELRAEASIK